ncbi:MAG: EscU/YscU/HrcU family type III secretion system export apparatus switch protein [Cyanobacteria bacterium]|nr:EscU/YscU/HrcU family type III secretion system export apparatus switch protein [Cyanobacteriota bacterium]
MNNEQSQKGVKDKVESEKKAVKKAVALKYEKEKYSAPQVIAKGQREIAKKIIEKAEEFNIPLYEDANLTEILSKLDVGSLIPPEIYKAVAEVLAWVYLLDKKSEPKRSESKK